MRMYDIIRKKRDGGELSKEEIDFFIDGYVKGEIPDYQASALLMAIFFNGMNFDETVALTFAVRDSGQRLDFSSINGIRVDKHSTGRQNEPRGCAFGCFSRRKSGEDEWQRFGTYGRND